MKGAGEPFGSELRRGQPVTDQERAFEAAADAIASTPSTDGLNGWRDRLIAAAKEYVSARERMTGAIGVDGDGNLLIVTIEEARRMKREGPRIVDTDGRRAKALQRRSP